MKILSTGVCLLLLISSLSCKPQSSGSTYEISKKFPVEGDGGWDYIVSDDATGRLFIAHSNVTQVIESKSGKLIYTIQDTKGVHGIALAHPEHKAFISCGKDSTVSIVDLSTLEFISKVKVTGANPDAILYDEFSHRVFVYNGRSANATVIDAKTDKVIATIPFEGKPEASVSDGNGKVYINIEDKSKICVINSISLKVENCWSIAPGEEPSGLALDNETHRLFSVCDNEKMIVLDALSGKVISSLKIGRQVDGCMFDKELKRIYSSNGEGSITVVQEKDANTFSVLETIPTQRGARTLCLNELTHMLYLPTAEYGETPASTPQNQRPRPSIKPGSFVVLEVKRVK